MSPLPVAATPRLGEGAVGDGRGLGPLLGKAEEEHPHVARLAPIEAERELVQVRLEVLGLHSAMMGAKEPALQQGDDPVHRGQQAGGSRQAASVPNRSSNSTRVLGKSTSIAPGYYLVG